MVTAVGAWILWRARHAAAPGRKVVVGAAHIIVVVVLMVLMRDVVRRATLVDAVHFDSMPVAPQWGAIVLFLVLLVAGLIAIGWMVRAAIRGARTTAAASE
jgi:hypothetical protein